MDDIFAAAGQNDRSLDYANQLTGLNDLNLRSADQQNQIGNRAANTALDASQAIQGQARNVERQYQDLGFLSQENNMRIQQGASNISNSSMQSGNGVNGLLSGLAVGGALANAAIPYIRKPWSPPAPVGTRKDTITDIPGNLYG
jgi:hypothetical protein